MDTVPREGSRNGTGPGRQSCMTVIDPTARNLLPRAATTFTSRVHAVPSSAWDRPTPCDGWSVTDLVGHLVEEHLWVPPLLAGQSVEEVGDRFDGHVLGDDPVAAWEASVTASMQAWREVSLDRQVHLSYGPTPVLGYAEEMLLDLVVHGWDLARGAGLDERGDADLVEHVLVYVTAHLEEFQSAGLFGPPVEVTSDDPQDRLLGALGRSP